MVGGADQVPEELHGCSGNAHPGAREVDSRKARRRTAAARPVRVGYNRNRWEEGPPEDVARALQWMAKNSVPVPALEDAATFRVALDALGLKADGKPAAPRTARRKRAWLSDVLGLAVEERYFTTPVNPLTTVKWVAPKSAEEVDPESVANPRQARSLLKGVREQGPRGAHLEAFFGCLYYAAMRPAEATALRREQCHLPETGWGTLTLRQRARKDVLTEQEAASLLLAVLMISATPGSRSGSVPEWIRWSAHGGRGTPSPFCFGCTRRCWHRRRSVPTIGSMRRCGSGTNGVRVPPVPRGTGGGHGLIRGGIAAK